MGEQASDAAEGHNRGKPVDVLVGRTLTSKRIVVRSRAIIVFRARAGRRSSSEGMIATAYLPTVRRGVAWAGDGKNA